MHNGHNIRNIRREKGLQHAALEKLLGMTTQQLIAIENEEVVNNETPILYGYTEEFMEEYQSHVRNMLKIQEHFEKQLENRCNTLEDMVDTLKTQIQAQNEQIKALPQVLKK